MKPSSLRKRTEALDAAIEDAIERGELLKIAIYIEGLGTMLEAVSYHRRDLQRKVDWQAGHITDLEEKLASLKGEKHENE